MKEERITLAQCEEAIRPHLTAARFAHSVCVSQMAGRLAAQYGADAEKAAVAGMLHDIMKDTPKGEQLKIIDGFGIMMTQTERRSKKLYHGIAGAAYAEKVLGVKDKEVLSAIRWHTSGRAEMTLLEKVLFVADYISDDRDYPGVADLRVLSKTSLEAVMVEGICFTMGDLLAEKQFADENMIMAYNDALAMERDRKNTETSGHGPGSVI